MVQLTPGEGTVAVQRSALDICGGQSGALSVAEEALLTAQIERDRLSAQDQREDPGLAGEPACGGRVEGFPGWQSAHPVDAGGCQSLLVEGRGQVGQVHRDHHRRLLGPDRPQPIFGGGAEAGRSPGASAGPAT